jgi:hypothetical protein
VLDYRRGLPELTLECREPLLHADLADADSQAVRAVERFLEITRGRAPRSGEASPSGAISQRHFAAGDGGGAGQSLLATGWAALGRSGAMAAIADAYPGLGIAPHSKRCAATRRASGLVAVEAQLDSVRLCASVPAHPPAQDLAVRDAILRARCPRVAGGTRGVGRRPRAPGSTSRRSARAAGRSVAHLAHFHRAAIRLVAVREGCQAATGGPGVAADHRAASAGSDTAVEGWAHYCEQMMVEEGLGSGDPRIELAWHERSLAGAGRLVAAISLHIGAMSLEDAAHMFEERCFLPPLDAAREARRAARDPGCMAGTLGKWRILALRGEASAMLGPDFRLREFHDVLLRQGPIPLPLAREGVLGELARRHRAAGGQER